MTVVTEDISRPSLRPRLTIAFGGSSALALISFFALPWPFAIASTVLGMFMIAGADVDARTCLLPDAVTFGALASGLAAALLLEPIDALLPLQSICLAVLRAGGTALVLGSLRFVYGRLRGVEGLGLGDVKLAAAVGAWLPLEAIPTCFSLAAAAALISVFILRPTNLRDFKLPFGTFLCPALWLVFFAVALTG